jgi:hypothetical protein
MKELACLKVLFWNSSGRTEENRKHLKIIID